MNSSFYKLLWSWHIITAMKKIANKYVPWSAQPSTVLVILPAQKYHKSAEKSLKVGVPMNGKVKSQDVYVCECVCVCILFFCSQVTGTKSELSVLTSCFHFHFLCGEKHSYTKKNHWEWICLAFYVQNECWNGM